MSLSALRPDLQVDAHDFGAGVYQDVAIAIVHRMHLRDIVHASRQRYRATVISKDRLGWSSSFTQRLLGKCVMEDR